MPLEITLKSLRDRRRSTIAWSLGLTALVALMCAYWPSVRDNTAMQEFVRDLPEGLRAVVGDADYGTAVGFLGGELFAFLVPLLLLVVTIGMGAGAVAAEERRGTADLLFSAPIGRSRILLAKVAAGVVVVALLGSVLFAALAVGAPLVEMDVAAGRLAAACASAVLLAMPFGALALAVSCATGRRGSAAGIAATAAVAAFLLDSLAPLVASLEGWQRLSPWAWYDGDRVLRAGLELADVALLAGSAAVLVAIAAVALERRDLGV